VRPVGFKEASGRADNGQREGLPRLAQLAQADAESRVLAGTVAGFEVSEALNDAHRRIR
jgi:hypothetical protein